MIPPSAATEATVSLADIGAYYERLGVRPQATQAEIRSAYRALARRHHPDTRGGRPSPEMAAINEAWSVLSDPARRARYDADLRVGADVPVSRVRDDRSTTSYVHVPSATPARFPWRFVLFLVVIATAAILVLGALTNGSEPAPIDNLVQVGSCVDIDDARGEAFEVPCDGLHEAEVKEIVPFDGVCSTGLIGYRDRQGMGKVCVVVR
ncbi:MAG: J domain-containing protein [Ilumatobacteraceae bacterium]